MNASTDILLVEDDPNDVRLAMAVFRKIGLDGRCSVAGDGEEAVNYLRWRQAPALPRLVLLDLKTPRMDGFQFLEQVKADPELGLVPVVVLTSSREQRDIQRAYALRANGYVVKGINFAEYGRMLRIVAEYWTDMNALCTNLATRDWGKLPAADSAIFRSWFVPSWAC